ncbi:MAG: hypothetical protein JO115_13555 [Pseudonocardiales bacterium]|nr:hypothetical protein [Pseudonocardiales bacterium]
MPQRSPRAADDEWRDARGTPITLRARVEPIAIDPAHGALPALLHQHGRVIGWGAGRLYVIFEHL